MSTRIPMFVRSLFVFAVALIALCTSSLASAAGRTQWKSKTFKERSDKAWNLEVAIYLPSAPDVPHVPMKFEFQPEVYYERDMMDGDKLVERKVPLDNRQALIESVDVEFLDSGTGKIEPRTRFTFKLTRAHGYEAGEYKVSIHDGRNDQSVGAPVTLIFEGENEIIDRRAMVFTGNDKDKKKRGDADTKKVADDKDGDDKAAAGEDRKSDDAKPADSDAPPAAAAKADDKPNDEPGTIKQKPGGCGCRLADTNETAGTGLALAVLGLSVVLVRRRNKRAD